MPVDVDQQGKTSEGGCASVLVAIFTTLLVAVPQGRQVRAELIANDRLARGTQTKTFNRCPATTSSDITWAGEVTWTTKVESGGLGN